MDPERRAGAELISTAGVELINTTKASVERNYAPVSPMVKALPRDDYSRQAFSDRQARRRTVAAHVVPEAQQSRHAMQDAASAARLHKQQQYAKRVEKYNTPVNHAEYLVPRKTPNYAFLERLNLYNKHHRCQHGLRFNELMPIMSEQDNTYLDHYIPKCSHDTETINLMSTPEICPNCNARRYYPVVRENCICDISRCTRCSLQLYSNTEPEFCMPPNSIVCQCGSDRTTKGTNPLFLDLLKNTFTSVGRANTTTPKLPRVNEWKISQKRDKRDLTDFPVLQATKQSGYMANRELFDIAERTMYEIGSTYEANGIITVFYGFVGPSLSQLDLLPSDPISLMTTLLERWCNTYDYTMDEAAASKIAWELCVQLIEEQIPREAHAQGSVASSILSCVISTAANPEVQQATVQLVENFIESVTQEGIFPELPIEPSAPPDELNLLQHPQFPSLEQARTYDKRTWHRDYDEQQAAFYATYHEDEFIKFLVKMNFDAEVERRYHPRSGGRTGSFLDIVYDGDHWSNEHQMAQAFLFRVEPVVARAQCTWYSQAKYEARCVGLDHDMDDEIVYQAHRQWYFEELIPPLQISLLRVRRRLRAMESPAVIAAHPQGGVMTMMKDTTSLAVQSALATIQNMLEKGRKAISDLQGRCVNIMRVDRLYGTILDFVATMRNYVDEHPELCAAVGLNIVSLLLASTRLQTITPFLTLFAIYRDQTKTRSGSNNTSEQVEEDKSYMRSVWDFVVGLLPSGGEPENDDDEIFPAEAQGFTDRLPELVKFMMKLFPSSLSFQVLFKHMASFAREFNALFTMGRNVLSIMTGFLTMLPKFLMRFLTRNDPALWLKSELKDPLSLAHRVAVQALSVAHMTTTESVSAEDLAQARVEARASLDELKREFMVFGHNIDFQAKKQLDIFTDLIETTTAPRKREKEPFCIKISGGAGCGKSTMWPLLASPLFPNKSIAEIENTTYTRNVASETMDGVIGKEIFLIDDFNQRTDEIDLMEVVALVSKAAFAPPLASIDRRDAATMGVKGMTIEPKLVMLLSNVDAVLPKTINCAAAINRRKHVNIQVSYKNGYGPSSRQADFSHLSIRYQVNLHQELEKQANGGAAGGFAQFEVVSLQEAQQLIAEDYAEYLEKNREVTLSLPNFVYNPENKVDVSRVRKRETIQPGFSYAKMSLPTPTGQTSTNLTTRFARPEDTFFDAVASNVVVAKKNAGTFSEAFTEYQRYFSDKILRYYDILKNKALDCSVLGMAVFERYYAKFLVSINNVDWTRVIMASVAALASAFAIITAIRHMTQPVTAQVQSGEAQQPRHRVIPVKVQGGSMDTVDLVESSLVRLATPKGNTTTALFVRGNVLLVNEHLFHGEEEHYIADGSTVRMYSYGQASAVEFPFERTSVYPITSKDGRSKDLCLYRCPRTVPARKDIVKHFFEGDVVLTNRRVINVTLSKNPPVRPRINHTHIVKDNIKMQYETSPAGRTVMTTYHDAILYRYSGQNGDCGSPILIDDDSFTQGRIVAIHSAATNDGEAIGTLVTREMLEQALMSFGELVSRGTKQDGYIDEFITESQITKAGLEGAIRLIGTTRLPVGSNSKTNIVPSPLYGLITTPTTMPAILNPKDPRLKPGVDLYRSNVNKYAKPSSSFPAEHIREVQQSMQEDLFSIPTVSTQRVLTWDEAINGIPNMPYIDPLNMESSAGYPWNFKNFRGSKRRLFTFDEETQKYSAIPELQEALDEMWEDLMNGIVPSVPYIEQLKDERRPIKKVLEENKTRIISASPLALTICMRRLYLGFAAHFYQCRLKCFSAVGIIIGGPEFETYVRRLLEVGQNGFDGDYKGWDGTFNDEVQQSGFDIMSAWYKDATPIEKRAREAIRETNAHAYHLFDKYVFQIMGGTSSGIIVTTIINTIGGEEYLRLAWMALVPTPYNTMYHYRQHVRTGIYGDDNNVAVSDRFLPHYNQVTVASYFARFGITYTDADKNDSITPYKKVMDFSFLKMKFGYLDGRIVPQMNISDNLETLNWIRNGPSVDPDTACNMNANCVLRVAFFHGRNHFSDVRKRILELRPAYNLITYYGLEQTFHRTGSIFDEMNDFGFSRTERAEFTPTASEDLPIPGLYTLRLSTTMIEDC